LKGVVLPGFDRQGEQAKTMNESRSLSSEVAQHVSPGVTERQTEAISRSIIGERVRLARVAANLTQQELAGDMYSKSYISAVERGKMTPSFQALEVLAERLSRPISFFLGEGEVDLEEFLGNPDFPPGLPEEERQRQEAEARQMLKDAEEWLTKNQATKALAVLHVEAHEAPIALPLSERPRWYWLAGWAGVWAKRFPEATGWLTRGLEVTDAARAQASPSRRVRLGEMAERIRYFLGVCYYDQAQPAKALEYHSRCLAAITDKVVTDPELKLVIFKALGNDNSMLGRYEESITFYKQACKLAEDMNDPRQRGLAYWGLGQAYMSFDDLPRARTALQEAVDAFERLDDMELASRLHAMFGLVLTRLKEYLKAEQHLRLALKAAERINYGYARGIAFGNLAILFLEQGKPDEAIPAAQEGVQLLRESKSYHTEGQVYQTLAEAYEAKRDAAAAEQAYKEAIDTLGKTGDNKFIGQARERYGQFLAAQQRFAEAYEQLGLAQALLAR
jgi:tetratricopeptide (TPR) repeat protein